MSYQETVSRRRAKRQWRRLVQVLEAAGATLDFLEPSPTSSALSFTADGAFFYAPGRALVLRNDGPRGTLEPPLYRSWLRKHGYTVESMPPRYRLDGGNLLRFPNGDVLAGLKPNASGLGERYVARLLKLACHRRLWTVELRAERHLHLDTAVGLLADRAYLVYRPALANEAVLERTPLGSAPAINIGREDAERFACNLIVVNDVVITGLISASLARRISRVGFHVERLDLGEFHKAGGGARCLTLPLWRQP